MSSTVTVRSVAGMTLMGRSDERPRRRDGVLLEVVGEDVLALEPASVTVHQLNRTAAEILELCSGNLTLEQIVSHLSERYGVPDASVVHRDVVTAVGRLAEVGLVETGAAT